MVTWINSAPTLSFCSQSSRGLLRDPSTTGNSALAADGAPYGRSDMRKIAPALAILGTALVSALYTAPAHAQATRTWVSGTGNDGNPCSRTSPCETFAGAYAKTAAGGEIDALDPGGFGTLTISKSITIDGGGGTGAPAL